MVSDVLECIKNPTCDIYHRRVLDYLRYRHSTYMRMRVLGTAYTLTSLLVVVPSLAKTISSYIALGGGFLFNLE